jgi:hypothetical protein
MPGSDFKEFFNTLVDNGISYLPETTPPHTPWYNGTVDEHKHWLDSARKVMEMVTPLLQEAILPKLSHPDLHMGNIIVSKDNPTMIAAIIDWQSAAIEPEFWQIYQIPAFANFHANDDNRHIYRDTYINYIRVGNPKLYKALSLYRDMSGLFYYCDRSWDAPLTYRNMLGSVIRLWSHLDLPRDGLPHSVETAVHSDFVSLNYHATTEARKLRARIAHFLGTRLFEGAVTLDDFEAKEYGNKRLFRGFLHYVLWRHANGNGVPFPDEWQARMVWPFDL